MRRISIILILGLLFMGCMSLMPLPDAQQKIFNFNMDKDTLFVATNEWLAQIINDARVAIEFSDKESGKIIGDTNVYYISDFMKLARHRVRLNFNFSIKNKKVRLVIRITGTIHDFNTQGRPDANYNGINSSYVSAEKQTNAIGIVINSYFKEYKKYIETYNDDF